MEMEKEVYLILHNIRSLHNVGSLFRTADAAGVAGIILTGYTSKPISALGYVRPEIAKTALGAEHVVSWKYKKSIRNVVCQLKKEGVSVVALEQGEQAVDYRAYVPAYPMALIVGNEVRGLSKALQKQCDTVIHIPMRGVKESLNVSVAGGIALFELMR